MSSAQLQAFYQGTPVLVTGGEGFLGSSLAIRLAEFGAQVTTVDGYIQGCGANRANLQGWHDKVETVRAHISETHLFESQLKKAKVVFNLAGEISHTGSMRYPRRDCHLNVFEQLEFLEACARVQPGVRVVYAGTRQVYGHPQYLPVDEDHAIAPIDYNGVHKHAAEQYHLMLSRLGVLDGVVLRLTNVYGPRLALNVSGQGVLGVFFRHALLGLPLTVYGAGTQLRDPLFVDDAVTAFLLAGCTPSPADRVFQLAGPQALPLKEIASVVASHAPNGSVRLQPFPAGYEAIHIGSYYGSSARAAHQLGWRPKVEFAEGVRLTFAYFRERVRQYLGEEAIEETAPLP